MGTGAVNGSAVDEEFYVSAGSRSDSETEQVRQTCVRSASVRDSLSLECKIPANYTARHLPPRRHVRRFVLVWVTCDPRSCVTQEGGLHTDTPHAQAILRAGGGCRSVFALIHGEAHIVVA